MKEDYQNASPQLCTALDKFAERYRSAKSKSIPRLTSYLYDLNHNLDPTARVKSGSMIRVQVESERPKVLVVESESYLILSVKRRKIWILTLFLHERRRQQLKKS